MDQVQVEKEKTSYLFSIQQLGCKHGTEQQAHKSFGKDERYIYLNSNNSAF